MSIQGLTPAEIEAEVAGVVESKLVPNGQPVEYGEALFAIRTV